MKRILMFATLFLSLVQQLTGQTIATKQNDGRMNTLDATDRFQYIFPYDGRSIELRGSRYLVDTLYHQGELQTTNKLYTTELLYRYDQTQRMVQVKTESGKELWLNEDDVVSFKLFFGNDVIRFTSTTVPNGRKKTLMQVIYQSPTMHLLRDSYKFIFRVKGDETGYTTRQPYNEVRNDYRYFFNNDPNVSFQEIKINKKSFIKLMPTKKVQITNLFKANKSKGELTISKLSEILKALDEKNEKAN